MQTFLEATNLLAGLIYAIIVVVVVIEVRRLQIGLPRVTIALIAYFVFRIMDVLGNPDPVLGYDARFDAFTDLAVISMLLVILSHARRLTRVSMATVNEAKLRMAEYDRAKLDYSMEVHRKIAGPLSVIAGASQSLQHSGDDPQARERLSELIAESASALRTVSEELDAERARLQAAAERTDSAES